MNIVEKMKQDWDRRAKHHTRFWIASQDFEDEAVFARSGEHTAAHILQHIQAYDHAAWRVLDIGCGIGRVLKPLAPHFRELVGIDVSAEMITQSRTWLSDMSNIQTIETSGVDLHPFPTSHFDLVYSYVAFQHMPRAVFERYLEEINRVLTPHGLFLFQIPTGLHKEPPPDDTISIRFYTFRELRTKLRTNGFLLVDSAAQPWSAPQHTEEQHNFHGFLLAQKCHEVQPRADINVGWVQDNCTNTPSSLDTEMYLWFAQHRQRQGYTDEAIHTYEHMLTHNPLSLEAWLSLAHLLIDSGRIERAVATLQNLTHTHPTYHEGHRTLERLLQLRQPSR